MVNYATSDTAGSILAAWLTASPLRAAITRAWSARNAGESTKTIYIPVVDDGFSEGQESFNITLSSPGGAIPGVIPVATLAFTDNDATNKTSPVIDAAFFVRQQYSTPTAFVDALRQMTGLLNHPSRAAWITGLTNSTMTRAQVLCAHLSRARRSLTSTSTRHSWSCSTSGICAVTLTPPT